MRERSLETKEEVEAHNRLNAALLRTMEQQDAQDDPMAPFPGLRERPLG